MSIGGFDPDFSMVERERDEPPDEPYPRYDDEDEEADDDATP